MGCDIHFFTERWTNDNNYDGPRDVADERNKKIGDILDFEDIYEYRWVSADTWDRNRYEREDYAANELYSKRNYYLFSILADVRNYDDIIPISPPRGVPSDASFGYNYIVDRWGGDGHSHTYFTLEELLNLDWSKYREGERSDWIDDFMETIESMKSIDKDPSNVRCCFFFDN